MYIFRCYGSVISKKLNFYELDFKFSSRKTCCGTHLDTVVKPFVVSLGDSKSPSKNWYEIIALLVDGR